MKSGRLQEPALFGLASNYYAKENKKFRQFNPSQLC
jgi:hypothetical protein